ncbi:MAG TPA: class I SAM-dependent methyltransferase [Gaiella sp.]|nr:class I SAM-dependent methyltransferase [Gaiella sp.]
MSAPSSATSVPPSPPAGLCPACRSRELRQLLSLDLPVHTSVLLPRRDEARNYPRGRVTLELCLECGLITNSAFDAPGHDYSASFEETQAFSPRFREYASELVRGLVHRHALVGRDVLEIGCGRGDVLTLLVEATGARGIGVDPSWRDDPIDSPAAARIEVVPEFLAEDHLDRELGLVLCRHTLEHVHDVNTFLGTVRRGLAERPGTPIVFEIPDTLRILREIAFWDVYYEHCSYFTPGSLARAFRAAGLRPDRLELGFEDQYVLLDAVVDGEGPSLPLEEPVATVVEAAEAFTRGFEAARTDWRRALGEAHARGDVTVVWGAGSKGVGFIASVGLDEEVACVVDVNPAKHGMFMPGSGHEIVPPDRLADLMPDLVVVMNPVYLGEIRADLDRLGVRAEVRAL